MSLGEALTHLEGSTRSFAAACRARCTACITSTSHDEWARFMSTVTDWDNETYMECLP